MKYKVTYEFRACVTVEVESEDSSENAIMNAGLKDAEEATCLNLVWWDATVRPA